MGIKLVLRRKNSRRCVVRSSARSRTNRTNKWGVREGKLEEAPVLRENEGFSQGLNLADISIKEIKREYTGGV